MNTYTKGTHEHIHIRKTYEHIEIKNTWTQYIPGHTIYAVRYNSENIKIT